MEKEIIIQLIAEDMLHNQLINGLNNIGLLVSDQHVLSLDRIVALTMGFSTNDIPDEWCSAYHAVMLNVPHDLDTKERHTQAEILFQTLSTIQ